MYKLTEESHVGSINDTNVRINGRINVRINVRINDADGRLNRFLADKKTTETSEEDSVYSRKVDSFGAGRKASKHK